jgi:hypothetical protein
MIEPKKILNYIVTNFDEIKTIYFLEKEYGYITEEQLVAIALKIDTLIDYSIIEEMVNETFKMRDIWYALVEGLLDDYSLDMPEQIAKYHSSISDLYRKLKSSSKKNESIKYAESLAKEVTKFESQLKRNIKKLIEETRDIKANASKLDYTEKMKRASSITKLYLEPLNIIMRKDADSVLMIIRKVQEEANLQLYNSDDENMQRIFSKLHNTFSGVEREIYNENRLLINEVAPLLERIRMESEILAGMNKFLSNPDSYKVPMLSSRTNTVFYSTKAKWDAQDVWDGYYDALEDVIINDSEDISKQWIYREDEHLKQLLKDLPIDNFYQWVYTTLEQELDVVESKPFLQISKLVFNKNIEVNYTAQRVDIRLEDLTLDAPVIIIKRKT